jgi:hypothetical protein
VIRRVDDVHDLRRVPTEVIVRGLASGRTFFGSKRERPLISSTQKA